MRRASAAHREHAKPSSADRPNWPDGMPRTQGGRAGRDGTGPVIDYDVTVVGGIGLPSSTPLP
jgi:hypothetical protein